MRRIVLLLACTTLLAGCGDQILGPGGTVPVSLTGSGFSPQTVFVPRGATVRWTNSTSSTHRIVGADGVWDSGSLPPGESWSRSFGSFGTFEYACALHTGETGRIIVE
jgi:plastocyanin